MSITIFIISLGLSALIALAYICIHLLKEYRYSQRTIKNRMRRKEEDDYNRWLHTIGLHETSYYFNPSGIRILNDWLLWKKNVLDKGIL